MGQLRSVLLARLHEGATITDSLYALDRFAEAIPAARHATVCIVELERSTGHLTYCTAGHPPPLIVSSTEDRTRYLPPTGAGPLATGSTFSMRSASLGIGDAVVLCTDGLLERPGVDPTAATIELRDAAVRAYNNEIMPEGASSSAVERICSLSVELLTRLTGHRDDLTILAAARRPRVRSVDVEVDADVHAAGACRARVRPWLTSLRIDPSQASIILHAVSELVANAAEHAYGGEPGTVRCILDVDDASAVSATVTDHGSWAQPIVTEGRGRGLALVRALLDRVEIDRASAGTTVTTQQLVGHPAGLLDRARGRTTDGDPELFDVWTTGWPEPTVTVLGPLDARTVRDLEPQLEIAMTEASPLLTLDLSGVSILTSAAVDLLFTARGRAKTSGAEMVVVAPAGTPAHHVLELVQFPHQP
jgi:anti-sigma regulatory factor (Ser/Thr protein kinase)/anti-anti-sigma regulatory factor